MYKLEDIRPKKYPEEKPSKNGFHVSYRVLFDNGTQNLYIWNPISKTEGMMTWNEYVTWFIDIPNPPDELKFLAYPENKPEEAGLYLAHYKPADDWGDIYYPDENIWDEHIDYFIPYRLGEPVSDTDELDEPLGNSEQLERENEVENGIATNIIYNSCDIVVSYYENKTKIMIQDKLSRFSDPDTIGVTLQELTAFARHWLDLQGYDVIKREPELLPCPVCGGKANLVHWDVEEYYIVCDVNDCPIRTLYYSTAHQAIKAWNVLPRKEKGVTQHEYDLRKGNPYDLNDVAKLTRKEK